MRTKLGGNPYLPRLARIVLACVVAAVATSCEDRPELPPEEKQQDARRAPETDLTHFATIRGTERVSIPNIKLVLLQSDTDGTFVGIALRSVPAGLDGSTLRFDKLRATTLKQLRDKPIILLGAGVLDRSGNGIFTPTKAYQPKFTEMRLSEVTDAEAHGKISGEFYVFRLDSGVVVPSVKELEIEFSAVVLTQ